MVEEGSCALSPALLSISHNEGEIPGYIIQRSAEGLRVVRGTDGRARGNREMIKNI
jgi:hypothetical protein